MRRFIDLKHKKKIRHKPALTGSCRHCGKEISYDLNEYYTFVKIFKYLLFPYNVTYRTECPLCGFGNEISEQQFKDLKYFSELGVALEQGKISPEEYKFYKAKHNSVDRTTETLR